MSKIQKKQSLKELQKVWNQRLAKSGFEDIEDENGMLKSWSGSRIPSDDLPPITSSTIYSSKIFKESQAEYYRIASQYLYSTKFAEVAYRKIWTLHSRGDTHSSISLELGISRRRVQYIIEKIRKDLFK